jgi:hypothetical protein
MVAAVLQDPIRLRTIIPQPAADHITRLLRASGNKRRTNPAALSDRALREYLRQIREVWAADREGRASSTQCQYLEEVVPRLRGMVERAEGGQT